MSTTVLQNWDALMEAIDPLGQIEPRPWQDSAPRDYAAGTYGYTMELDDSRGLGGAFEIVPTDGRHLHLSSGNGGRQMFSHRGRFYSVHFSQHVYLHPDGTWKAEHPDPVQNEPRNGAGRLYGAEDVPALGRAKLQALLVEAANEWAAESIGELFSADQAALNNAARSREEAVRESARDLLEKLNELRKIERGDDDAPRY